MLELNDRGIPVGATYDGQLRDFGLHGVHFLTEQEIADGDFDNDEKPVFGLTAGELERLSEIALVVQGDVDVWRDWENCLTVFPNESWRDTHDLPCALTVSTNGAVAHYSVNQPRHFATLTELLIDYIDDLSAQERDRSTIVYLKRALGNVESALKAMPNHVDSVFDLDDVKRLNNVQRQLTILTMAESEIPS